MKEVFTTGEAARICKVSQQTIIRCFDSGQLRGFRVPGSRFRRIPREELIRFMRKYNIPMDALLEEDQIKVLVVDDDPDLLELITDVLQREKRFLVRTASTGFEAGMLVKEFEPDVIVLDVMLPDINGKQVCQRIRSDPDLKHVKILCISGMVNRRRINDLKRAGADDFLAKPFSFRTLVERICDMVDIAPPESVPELRRRRKRSQRRANASAVARR